MGNTISLKNKIFYIFILCLAVFIAADDQTVVVTLLPSMVLDLGISVGELNKISWTITSYLLGFTLVMPLAGKLCDKFGYRLVLIFSMIIFSIGSLLIGITVNLPESNYVPSKLNWLIVFRFFQAMGGGAIIPIAIASVSLILEKKYWIYGFGLIGASAEAGGVIGPLWGSLILEIWDWPAAFFINIPLAILIIFLALFMPKSKKNKHQIKFLDISLFSLIIIISTIFISEYDGLDFTQIILLITILTLVIITTIKIRKSFTPTLSSSTKYDIYFRNSLFNPHSGHNSTAGGILSSTGFKVTGSDLEQFLDDDGAGNVRRYYLSSGIRTYSNETQGTIDYSTGQITLNSLNIASISNIRGATSTVVELTVTPNSNDVVPVRDQIVEIDIANSTINVTADSFVGGSADAGVGYTTTSSY